MSSITTQEMQELVLRLDGAHPQLQELSARYFQVRAAQQAAEQIMADPAKQTPEWKTAAQEFPKAARIYKQAGDSLAALVLCGLWPAYGTSVGDHLLALCDRWVDQPEARGRIEQSIERIHFAMMQMGQVAADPTRPKPAGLSSSARMALEASGWGATGARAPETPRSGAKRAMPPARAAKKSETASAPKAKKTSPRAKPAANRAVPIIRPIDPMLPTSTRKPVRGRRSL